MTAILVSHRKLNLLEVKVDPTPFGTGEHWRIIFRANVLPNYHPIPDWLFARRPHGSDEGSDMPPLNVSTDFTDNGTTPGWGAHHVLPTGQGRRYSVGGIILSLLVLPLLAASLAAAAWLFWLLANGVLGPRGTLLGVVSLIVGGTALSWYTEPELHLVH